MILIVGSPEETHARHVFDALTEKSHAAAYVDTRTFPGEATLGFEPGPDFAGSWQDVHTGLVVNLADVTAIYWRMWLGGGDNHIEDAHVRHMVDRDVISALGSWLRCHTACRWVNSPEAIALHEWKGYQLHLLASAGIRIPRTCITNDAAMLKHFYEDCDHEVIFKPVRGGAHTQAVTPEDFSPERLFTLRQSPVQFQERIPGVDIRAYRMGSALFAAEIQAGTLDFREDPEAPVVPVTLPDEVSADCHRVADLFGLVFTGIDLRRTPQGEYVFIEANPSPMFIGFETRSGYPVTETLLSLLVDSPVSV